mmetsp:Transcript_12890/g.30178  ORF Transcript_12890/g.30178 Transcript_12890/m.30178 type:complete len:233 (+) Transcript_12890:120-818(+)
MLDVMRTPSRRCDPAYRTWPEQQPAAIACLLLACALVLSGCNVLSFSQPSCQIEDVYKLIRVNGNTGHSKEELEQLYGVRLCSRHLHQPATYEDGVCQPPEYVFSDGTLPPWSSADPLAMLLLWCPQAPAAKGSELQRVTCSYEPWNAGASWASKELTALRLRFDEGLSPRDCLVEGPSKPALASEQQQDATSARSLMRTGERQSVEVTPHGDLVRPHRSVDWDELADGILR